MTSDMPSLGDLSDRDLLALVDQAVGHERQATARLIALLMEVDARKLYLKLGCSSLFTYCVQVLHLSEHAAYLRIEAARATRAFPVILERLADGSLHLTAISLLRPHLTPANHLETLDAARHKSKRDVEQLIARMRPQSDVPSVVRKLPAPKPAALPPRSLTSEACANSFAAVAPPIVTPSTRPPEVKLLALERYKVQFTVSRETYNKLRQVQDLLRHTIPNGDPAAIFDRALTLLLAEVMKTKLAATDRPRQGRRTLTPSSRHIPAAIKREVWRRDGGQCAFRRDHRRCTETGFLEFHHVVPYARGGATTIENLELRCRAHNVYEAEQQFGPHSQALFVRETRALYRAAY